MIKSAVINFDKFIHETHGAILVRLPDGNEHWIPKKLCRNFKCNNKLRGSVSVPAFLVEKMGLNIEDLQAEVEIIHMKPIKVEFDPNKKPDASLIK